VLGPLPWLQGARGRGRGAGSRHASGLPRSCNHR
jgi:hypothetical protein